MSELTKIDRRQMLALGVGAAALAGQAASAQSATEDAAEPDLTGKSILVTGASSGFGRLGGELYARLGAKVFATMRNVPRAEADELRDLAASDNLDLSVIEIDVTSDEQVEAGEAATGRIASNLSSDLRNIYDCWRARTQARAYLPGDQRHPWFAVDAGPCD